MKVKKTLLLVFFVLAGIIVGSLLADVCSRVPFLSWMAYGRSIGISSAEHPFVIDLSVLKLAFGFEFRVNVSQIICIVLSIFGYRACEHKI